MTDISALLPDSLKLSPHLSAHKYFFVCALTVAAWDTLVLSPRTWKLLRTKEWPPLKIIYHFIRIFMPIEFIIVAVMFFDTDWSQATCRKSYLFEPIATAFLLAICSVAHVIRIHAIYERSRQILALMGGLWAVQVVTTAISSGFYQSVPLLLGQGCIAGPKHKWVGIYWVAPTLLYSASFGLAIARSLKSLEIKELTLWKLMLRDGLNLYGAIWIVNMANVLFWFIMKPTDETDSITTIVTSMAAVLTTSMTMRIILSVRGSLVSGGSFAVSSSGSHSGTSGSRNTHGIRTNPTATANSVLNINAHPNQTYTINEIGNKGSKGDEAWMNGDGKSVDSKGEHVFHDAAAEVGNPALDVKITVDTETDYNPRFKTFAREK
jgi:hypothetical protein